MNFSELGLSPKVLAAVEAAGYTQPTPIQEQAIPHVLERRDVMGIAQTGTGKTAAFTLPMISLTERGRARARMPRTLILEPTRELAAQVEENFNKYGINHKLNVALLIGGVSFEDQMRKLDRGADVLIATPGRLLDLFERGRILMTGVEILVIDEADRMLDMGFIPDIERIVGLVPFTRQTLFFSATMPPEIERLAEKFLQNPVQVAVAAAASTAKTVEQTLVATPSKDFEKRVTLRTLIDNAEELKNGIIFCNRKRDVATLHRSLMKRDYSVGSLHGDMDQTSRMKTLDGFRSGTIKLLVASDVAARGLDIPDVSHVFNFDVPIHAEDYVHRIGRCGRAGRDGWAFTLVAPSDDRYLKAILKLTGDELPWLNAAGEATEGPVYEAGAVDDDRPRGRGRRGKADAETANAPRKRSSRGSKTRDTANPIDTPATDVAPVSAKSEAPPPERKERRPKQRRDDQDKTPQGLGDHVPAFLLRSASNG
ncbi:MAG: DEAD/DEAH box helicase [Pseudomonadota bacterium]